MSFLVPVFVAHAPHELVLTSWCGQPLQAPIGQPAPACAISAWISCASKAEPT
jgi:hypothetical protein